jgi:hypothetical protein
VRLLDRNLIDYLPDVLKEVRELKLILQSEQVEVESLWDALEKALNDQFVLDSTENGVLRWEKILKITPKATDSLDARKFRILTRLNEQLPYTMAILKQQLNALCGSDGYSIKLYNDTYTLEVKVNLTAKSNFEDVSALLHRTVPANIVIDLKLLCNQHLTLAQFTHEQLHAYTHNQLRNEVLV